MYKRHDIVLFDVKNGRVQDEKSQRDREDRKNKRGGENRKVERDRRGYYRNKVYLVIGKSSDSKENVYHHKIYQCH